MVALKGFTSSFKSVLKWTLPSVALFFAVENTLHYTHPTYHIQGISMMPSVAANSTQQATAFWLTPKRHDIFMISPESLDSTHVTHPTGGPYIKRLVGLPGDTLRFNATSGVLTHINGTTVNYQPTDDFAGYTMTSKLPESKGASIDSFAYWATFENVRYPVFVPSKRAFASSDPKLQHYSNIVFNYPWLKIHTKRPGVAEFTIPEGFYFALSDNGTTSTDSRHFGLVPESALKHKVISK